MELKCEQKKCNKEGNNIFKAKIGSMYIELNLCDEHFQEVLDAYNECFYGGE